MSRGAAWLQLNLWGCPSSGSAVLTCEVSDSAPLCSGSQCSSAETWLRDLELPDCVKPTAPARFGRAVLSKFGILIVSGTVQRAVPLLLEFRCVCVGGTILDLGVLPSPAGRAPFWALTNPAEFWAGCCVPQVRGGGGSEGAVLAH